VESYRQKERAQNLPDQWAGTSIEVADPAANSNPVEDNAGIPAPDRVAGHIVYGQLFFNVNVTQSTPESN